MLLYCGILGFIPLLLLLASHTLHAKQPCGYEMEGCPYYINKHLYIHGEIDENKNNPIVPGYGDEFCEEYQILERYADNKLFK